MVDCEQEGQRFYDLATRHTDDAALGPVCRALSQQFTLARRAWNTLSDRYLITYP